MGGKRNKVEKRAKKATAADNGEPKQKKQRKKTPWKMRQLKRIERALKPLTKLSSVLTAAKAPGVDASLINIAFGNVGQAGTQIALLKDDWKPAKGHNPGNKRKTGVGDTIRVKDDLDLEGIKHFKHLPKALYDNAVVIDDDGRAWWVKCTDGATRVLPKRYTQKIHNAAPATAPATSVPLNPPVVPPKAA